MFLHVSVQYVVWKCAGLTWYALIDQIIIIGVDYIENILSIKKHWFLYVIVDSCIQCIVIDYIGRILLVNDNSSYQSNI